MPLCYLPLGPWGMWSALCNAMMADVLMSLHLFMVFTPSHTGDDLPRWADRPGSRAENVVRQIACTANYTNGLGDLSDLLHLWLNYHIEHHVFPDVPLRTYPWAAPKLRAICEKHGVPYVQEPALRRFKRMVDVFVGTTEQKIHPSTPMESAQPALA
jgi:fatty acid desaturase